MRKDIGDKIYSIIITILVFSIVYQTGFLIANANVSLPKVFTDVNTSEVEEEKKEEVEPTAVKSATTDTSDQTETDSDSSKSGHLDLFLYVLQQVIPYNNDATDYSIKDAIKYVTKVDLSDPKTLISSQIPIIDHYEEDDLEITAEEEKEIYSLTVSKPLNDDEVVVNNTHMTDKPLVLIYHTHTTESYTSTSETKIDYSSYARSRNEKYNMVAVGAEIKKVLEEEYGIVVIQDTTVHDYPNYNVSYSNSLESIKKQLEKYPSIKYVFDIHRDGLAENKNNKEKYATVVNEVNSAKVMMVIGLNHENSAKNSQFSDQVYNKLKEMYPSLALPTLKRSTAKYNQFVSDNAVLFEVGSNLSTLEEAKASGRFLGDTLGKVITENETN